MKLPKCPHCGKLMASNMARSYEYSKTPPEAHGVIVWLCPERVEEMEPDWVEVEGIGNMKTKTSIPERAPRYSFGDVLVTQGGFRGRVSMMFANYGAILSAGIVGENWFDIQKSPPSTKDQVFYHLVGDGSVLAGELDVYSALEITKK